MNAKPRGLRVRIPANEFGNPRARSDVISNLGLSGPLRGLRRLNQKLDEALAVIPSARSNGRRASLNPNALPYSPRVGRDKKRGEQRSFKVHYAGHSADAAGMGTKETAPSMAIMTKLEAAYHENKTLREALAAVRDVLIYEIRRREEAEGRYRRFRQSVGIKDEDLPVRDPSRGAPRAEAKNIALNKSRHYSIWRSHKQSPSARMLHKRSAAASCSMDPSLVPETVSSAFGSY